MNSNSTNSPPPHRSGTWWPAVRAIWTEALWAATLVSGGVTAVPQALSRSVPFPGDTACVFLPLGHC